jgi:hypothetical protein
MSTIGGYHKKHKTILGRSIKILLGVSVIIAVITIVYPLIYGLMNSDITTFQLLTKFWYLYLIGVVIIAVNAWIYNKCNE